MKSLMPQIDSNDGLFHNGNPATGEQGTRVTDTWLNNLQDRVRDVQAEAHYVLQKAGFRPVENKQTQLYEAIVKIIDDNRKTASLTQKGEVRLTSDTGLDSEELGLTARAGKKLAQLIATVQLALNNYIPLNKRSSAVNSSDENNVATSKAVKTAYDKGVDAKNAADNAQRAADNANNNANTRVAKSGDTMTGNLTVPNLIVNDPTNNNNFVQIGDDTKLIDVDMGHTVGLQTTDNANDAYIAYGATKKRFGFDGANFSAESGLGAQWFGSQKRGEGAYIQQWQTEAPYHVNAGNANGSNTYFPYLKGKVFNGDGWGSAFSFGYTTPGARNQFGAGIIHLIEDNGREKWWEFAHNGNFRSAADVVTGSGKSLNNTHQQSYDYVQVTSSGHYGGLSILKPDGKSMRFEREGNAFKFWNQDMYSILMPERGGTVLLDTDFFYQKIGNFEIRKYPDGTMIQTNTVNFRGGYSHGTVYSFNWAVSFVAAPMVFGNGKAVEDYRLVDRFQMDIKTKSNGSTYYYYLYDPGGEQGDWDMQFLAIGRWK